MSFDSAEPTSLLYERTGDGYELIGAMYTAPRRWTQDKLDQRVPLSVACHHSRNFWDTVEILLLIVALATGFLAAFGKILCPVN